MRWIPFLHSWKHLIIALVASIPIIIFISIKPSNQRDWSEDQAILSQAIFTGDHLVTLKNIRNISYRSKTNYTVAYYDKRFDLNDIEAVWYICEPFSTWRGLAHTFISFEFKNHDFLAISVEIRKEKGESFSPLKGFLKQFEIMYVIGDEKDLIKLRSNYRHDEVFLYPLTLKKEVARELFVRMLKKTNALYHKPEFYHSLTNTCATTLVDHINHILPGRIPFSFSILFPGFSDDYFFHLGLIKTTLPFSQYRNFFKINQRAEKFNNDPDFSILIRKFNE